MAQSEGSSKLLIVLFIGLLGAGGYNYHRNFQAEAAIPRPYKSYSVEDLEALLGAYESEASSLEQRYEAARNDKGPRMKAGLLDQNLAVFEAAQRRSAASRGLGEELSMQKAAAGEIEAELTLRRQHADVMKLHLKRLLTI